MERFKQARKKAGLTAQEAAAELGVALSTLSNWERAVTYPSSPHLIAMAKLYDVSVGELLQGVEEVVERRRK